MLRSALSSKSELLTVSFSRQYPEWLFPGESDKDPAFNNQPLPGVEYILDSINPLTWRAAARRIEQFRPAALVVPWWTFYWSICYRYIAGQLQRTGIPVIFFCHNVMDHESAYWKKQLTRSVLKRGSAYLAHTETEREHLQTLLDNPQVLVHPHPIYDQFPISRNSLPRRAACELLFFGFIRKYKGLDILIRALSQLKDRDIVITVAGECWGDIKEYRQLAEEYSVAPMIDFQTRYHTESESAELFSRADIVVLPYLNATGSGVIPLAYHYGKPVVATRVGGLPDVIEQGITGMLAEPNNPEALANAIRQACSSDWPELQEGIQRLRKQLTWDNLALEINKAVARIGQAKGSPPQAKPSPHAK